MLKILKRKNKYGAKSCSHDGYHFPSLDEGRRYISLKTLLNSGKIANLSVHPRYKLHAAGVFIGHYVPDFSYNDLEKNIFVVEDVKGKDLEFGQWKRKHLLAEYGIDVVLIRHDAPLVKVPKPRAKRKWQRAGGVK